MNKDLLIKAIIAFDAIVQDVLSEMEKGKEMHPSAEQIMEMLADQLTQMPDVVGAQKEYVLNMADLGGRLRMMAVCLPMTEVALKKAIDMQRERLEQLKKSNLMSIEEDSEERVMH